MTVEGSRARNAALVGVAVGVAVLVVAAFLLGRHVKSPNQAAATASPPKAAVLTATVERKTLSHDIVFRADVVAKAGIAVAAPQLSGDAIPIVTSADKHAGDALSEGDVLGSVAGRPIIVLAGAIPSYRSLVEGDSGPDVEQLQRALGRLGYGTGTDRLGRYGPGTARSVDWLYDRLGYSAVLAATPAASGPEGAASGAPAQAATVPLGEVVFVPAFPVVVASTQLVVGQRLGDLAASQGADGGPGSARAATTVASLGAGGASFRGTISSADAVGLRAGLPVSLDDDANGGSWTGKITSIGVAGSDAPPGGAAGRDLAVVVEPDQAAAVPTSELGQNVRATIHAASSGRPTLVVPVAAVFTGTDGRSYVSLLGNGHQRRIAVVVRLSTGGEVAIDVPEGALRPGDAVVVGTAASKSPAK